MLAGGEKKACGRKVPMGLPRLPFAKANFGYYCIGINGQDQMTVAILLLFESLKNKFQRFKLCVIRRNKVSFKTKIMRIHPHPSTRNGKKRDGYYKTSNMYTGRAGTRKGADACQQQSERKLL